jgi:hypothetical protein
VNRNEPQKELIMANKFYGKLLPDYGDLDNQTGTAPGYRVYVLENDGGDFPANDSRR